MPVYPTDCFLYDAQMEVSQAKDCGLLGILPEQPTTWQSCPCCWKTCQAAIGDACLGITHLRSAAKNMHGIAAFYDATIMCGLQSSGHSRQESGGARHLWNGGFSLPA